MTHVYLWLIAATQIFLFEDMYSACVKLNPIAIIFIHMLSV